MAYNVALYLFDAFSTYCLANAVEPLRAANTLARKPLYQWSFVAFSRETVLSSSGLPVTPEGRLTDHPGGDLLLVLPSYYYDQLATPDCLRSLRAARKRFRNMAGLDTGSWLLAAAGLLEGHRATIHWDEIDRFAETFPETEVVEDRVVMDGTLWSCGGGATTQEMMLALIERQHGAMLAAEVSALFMQGEMPDVPNQRGSEVARALSVMRRQVETPLSIPAIAGLVGLSQRALEQAFYASLGKSPDTVYKTIRLSAARRMVETTGLTISEIATRVGYENPSAFTRAFSRAFGQTPRQMRNE